jgi:HSP20 family protein
MGFFDFLRKTKQAEAEPDVNPVQVYETADEVILTARLPGVAKSELSVNIQPTQVSVKVQRKRAEEHEVQAAGEYAESSESETKSFAETVSLPHAVRHREAQAKFANGVLEIRMPKHHAAHSAPKGAYASR